jgi:hypothetical protein
VEQVVYNYCCLPAWFALVPELHLVQSCCDAQPHFPHCPLSFPPPASLSPPTIFPVGGNHEAANYLWELFYGGWAAPNIFFLGYAGVVNFGGLRIGGISGIYKGNHYNLGHFEVPPYSEDSIRSAYHVRALEVQRLLSLEQPLDVFLSHDWPQGIARHGDLRSLLQHKSFLRQEVSVSVCACA